MEYIRVTKENLEKEHICCAISNNKDIQVSSKKAWLADRFDEGLVFLKSVERGKCFIEYIPAECAWNPIEAPGYMYINCLWVSGSFKGHGYSSDLLSECIEDSKEKGKEGLCILAAARKKPFLADPKFLKYKGFEACDEADNGIQLWYLPFEKKTEPPVFKKCAKHPHINERGYVLYYTNQCPFNAKYVPILEETAQKNGIPFKAVKIESRKDAQNVPTPITTYALFCDGEYVTNEQMNDKKFFKAGEQIGENNMASTKEYLDFVLEQLSGLDEISSRAMMGEFILYYHGKVFGGIYDDRLLVKPVPVAVKMMPDAEMEPPYDGAKKMILVDDVDNRQFLCELVESMWEELPKKKEKNCK